MILATLHFVSQAKQEGSPVVITSWGELSFVITCATALGAAITWYRHSRCHRSDCRRELFGRKLPLRRRGKYPHGHLHLCHIHHPDVPNDGQVTAEHVEQITRRLAGEKEIPHA